MARKNGRVYRQKAGFYFVGRRRIFKKIEEAFRKKALKELIKIILLGGAGAVALSGITSTSLSVALGLGVFAVADPEPISKAVVIAAVTAILGITAALLIWKIIKLLKDRDNIIFTFEVGPEGFRFLRIQFRAT